MRSSRAWRNIEGLSFLLNGNLCCGVLNDTLILRVVANQHAASMTTPHARPFDLTGRVVKGWVMVSSEGCASDDDLARWVRQGVEFAQSLPRK